MIPTATVIIAVFVGGSLRAEDTSPVIHDNDWSIEIRPAQATADSPSPVRGTPVIPAVYQDSKLDDSGPKLIGPLPPPAPTPAVTPRMSYREAYANIPFSRTEYEANPSYRHQAALEVMFGVLRPMTVHQQYTPRVFRYPDFYQYPYAHFGTQHIDVHQFGGGYNGWFNGQSPFGYPYGLRGNW